MSRICHQVAVIPYRIVGDAIEIALVTSVRGKRWILPKGSIDEGEEPHGAAVRETEEEAGLLGVLDPEPLGRYVYRKNGERCRVEVYLMHVTTALDTWEEDRLRRRRWWPLQKAAAHLSGDLRAYVHSVEQRAPVAAAK